ncbi:hypothetical protein MRBLWH7_000118 [Microbacterium sp. LWH7-1.2]|uniref:hypothetical protein n=1 Tax=Microbacterium sp. LWH7-1.2 TaxID=3135257 RepID=UPI003138EBA8
MANKPTQEVVDHYRLTHAEFQEFIQHVPHAPLKSRGINRASFNSVAYSLSRHGTFKTGEDIRITQAGLVDESGCSHNTVRKVVAFLKEAGVLELVDHQRHQGSPSENYRLRKSSTVKQVLKVKDRGAKVSTKNIRTRAQAVSVDTLIEPVDNLIEPVDTLIEPVDTLIEPVDNNKAYSITTRDSEFPAAPSTPQPSAGVGAVGKEGEADSWWDEEDLRQLMAGLNI